MMKLVGSPNYAQKACVSVYREVASAEGWNLALNMGHTTETTHFRSSFDAVNQHALGTIGDNLYIKDTPHPGLVRYFFLKNIGRELYVISGNAVRGETTHQLYEAVPEPSFDFIRVGAIRMRPQHLNQFVINPNGDFYVVVNKGRLGPALKAVVQLSITAGARLMAKPVVFPQGHGSFQMQYLFGLTVKDLYRITKGLVKSGKGHWLMDTQEVNVDASRRAVTLK